MSILQEMLYIDISRIKEGMLKVIGPSFCFELTIEYDARDEDFNWRLFTFEHKLGKFSNIDKVY